MKKEELQKEIGRLTQISTEFNDRDGQVRKNISGFLGSFKTDYYDRTKEVLKIGKYDKIMLSMVK